MSIQEELLQMAEEGYGKFHSGLIPGNDLPVMGVRTPLLRQKAKELAKGDWQVYLETGPEAYYEEVILKGLIIGTVSTGLEEWLELIRWFIPKISNWAVCDIFCSSLKSTKKYRKEVWEFLKPFLESRKEYEIRFGVVMILDYFADEDHAEASFRYFDQIRHEGYYVKMAVAWALSIYFIKVPKQTMEYLKKNRLDDWTYNKALQKITESYRVTKEVKEEIRRMKRTVSKKNSL